MPLVGNLMFTSSNISLEDLNKAKANDLELHLICVDIFGKRHEVMIPLDYQSGNKVYPKHGLSVSDKKQR
jgi:hypothetical protein